MSRNIELEKEVTFLRTKYQEVTKHVEIKVQPASTSLHHQELETEIDMLKDVIKAHDGEIMDPHISIKTANEASGKLSKALGELRIKFKKEKI